MKIKGIDKANITYCKSLLYEKKGDYKKALKQISVAKKLSGNKNMTDFLDERAKFVKAKMPKKQSKNKKETK